MDEAAKKPKLADWVVKAAAGRTLEQQAAAVREQGNHGAPAVLRAMALGANGIGRAAESAQNALVFGCYRPFSTPYIVRDAASLLARLGIGYTWLEKEYCCGLPLLHQASGDGYAAVAEAAGDGIRANRQAAAAKGAQTLLYCCAGCAHAAKGTEPTEASRHAYILDTLLDALAGRRLAVSPRRIAYFEGCHTSYRKPFPEAGLDWPRYRRFLDGIEGLAVDDAPGNLCCKVVPDKIADWAAARGAQALVCACSGCNVALRQAGAGKIPVMSYLELLVEALGEA